MKPFMKVGSFLLAAVMLFSALIAAGCTPISLNKEWSYRTSNEELPIGVYIYSLNLAYSQAETFAKELKDYDSSSDSWLDMEITDDDGKKAVAKDWIKDEAKTICLTYLVINEQLKAEGVEITDDMIASADEAAKTNWNVGPYAAMGYMDYIMPMKDTLEKYGVSFESFAYCTNEYSTRSQALFDAMYNEGGSQAVSDEELTKFFTENYTDYKYIPVNLYTSSADEAGQATSVALSDKEVKKIKDEIDGYTKDINGGKSFDDVLKAYMKANKIEADPSVKAVDIVKESTSLGDELKEAIGKLKTNKAATVQVGKGETAVYYLVFKGDIQKDVDEYINNEANRASVLDKMKKDDYDKYLRDLAGKLDAEENTSVINKYNPNMFFIKPEPTTAAQSSDSESKK